MSLQERISRASVILVGRCTSVEAIDPRRDHPEVALTKVTIAAENVLKGNPRSPEVAFYFYRIVGGFNGPKPNWVQVGGRGIFFLVEEQGVFRSVHDIWESHTDVFSGKHDSVDGGSDVESAIAEIVIAPGLDMDRLAYLQSLPHSVEFLGIGARRIVPLLEKLARDPDPQTRGYACVALNSVFSWADDCLADLVKQEGDADIQQRGLALLQQNAKERASDEKELRLAPAVFFSRIAFGGAAEARFVLERLLKHKDAIIRRRAADLLGQMSAVGY
jgi:hypothetical protein